MLSIPLKQTERVDLRRSLHAFVEASYSTEQADAHRDAFEEVHVLRERVRLATLTEKNHAATVATLAKYYRVVTSLRTRFGSAVEDSELCTRATSPPERWRAPTCSTSAWRPFNGGGASYACRRRSARRGVPRRACQLFQQAAHAVESVQGLPTAAASRSGPTADLSAEALGAWRHMMLAQAQQCFYEKAAREKIKPAVRAPRNSVRAIFAQFSEPLPLSTRWWPRSPRRRQSTTARRRRR